MSIWLSHHYCRWPDIHYCPRVILPHQYSYIQWTKLVVLYKRYIKYHFPPCSVCNFHCLTSVHYVEWQFHSVDMCRLRRGLNINNGKYIRRRDFGKHLKRRALHKKLTAKSRSSKYASVVHSMKNKIHQSKYNIWHRQKMSLFCPKDSSKKKRLKNQYSELSNKRRG